MTGQDEWDELVSQIAAAETCRDVEASGRRPASFLDRCGEWTTRVGDMARRDAKAATALESAMVLRERTVADLVGLDHLATIWCRFYQGHDAWDRWAEQVVIGLFPPMAALSTSEVWTLVLRLLDAAPSDNVISVIGAGPIEDLLSSDPETVATLIEEAAEGNARLRHALDHVWQMNTPEPQFVRVKRLAQDASARPTEQQS